MPRRTGIFAGIGAFVLLLAGYTVYWFTVAAKLDAGIDAWAAVQREAGITLEFARDPVHGFPLAFRTSFREPHAAGIFSGQAFDWHGPALEASVSPFNLHAIAISAPGAQRAAVSGVPLFLDAATLTAMLRFTGDGMLSQASVRFGTIKLTGADFRSITAKSGSAEVVLPPAPPRADQDPLLRFALSAEELQLPKDIQLLTSDPLGAAAIAGTVKGPMPMAPLRSALGSWRDQGGAVEITSFALAQATLDLAGSATVALDQDLQPIIAANMKARGLGPTIDLLASQRRIAPEEALKLKLFVHGAERDAPGGGKEVATGLTIQGGYLSWGPFKLARLPRVEWP